MLLLSKYIKKVKNIALENQDSTLANYNLESLLLYERLGKLISFNN